MVGFFQALQWNPVIPAIRADGENLDEALGGDHPAAFLLGGDIFEFVRRLASHEDRPPVFVNVDLVGGIAGDTTGLAFLSRHVEGIISTSRHVIELGNAAGLITIQRLFALDLSSIERGLKLVKRARPNCVEILPALTYPLLASRHPEVLKKPTLAGGLIKSQEEVTSVLQAGAAGVSTSYRDLWRCA